MPQIAGQGKPIGGTPLPTRMGAKQGGKMERVMKKGGPIETEDQSMIQVRAA